MYAALRADHTRPFASSVNLTYFHLQVPPSFLVVPA